MSVRAKFVCGGSAESYYTRGARIFNFYAVTQDGTPENDRFYKASPSGQLTITVDNPAIDFERGKAYYLDITAAE